MSSQDNRNVNASCGEDDEVHGGEEGREERQDAMRRRLVAAVAEAIEARRRAAEVDDHEEEGGKRIDAEMRAEPGQTERQGQRPMPAPDRRAAAKAR